LIKLRFTI